MAAVAQRYRLEHITLIAVNASEKFWRKAGFAVTADPALQRTVRSKYSDEAVHMEMQLGSAAE
jgi:hypothetical protein